MVGGAREVEVRERLFAVSVALAGLTVLMCDGLSCVPVTARPTVEVEDKVWGR